MIDASTRLKGVEQLIAEEQYFVIHAARQSGKTTYLKDLTKRLNEEGKYYALCCSLESVQKVIEPEKGIPAIISCIKDDLLFSNIPHGDKFAQNINWSDYIRMLKTELTRFCMLLDKPFVIFFDEADCLSDDTLIAFLRQLRDGYNSRPERAFLHSVALVGMRNIRDYKARVRPDSDSLGSASPFNIVTETFTLKNFTLKEITLLYQQHTDETEQLFEEDAIESVWEQTQGQPWLVNDIAREMIVKILKSDYTKPVTVELVNKAIQNIILDRPTHIDSLLERLKEDRVRRIIEPVILGKDLGNAVESDDFQYARDLGLIRDDNYLIKPANPIYAEVIIRKLSAAAQKSLQNPEYPYQMSRYLKNGCIDVDYLLKDFQQFWRENSEIWIKQLDYPEAAPHLVLMGFLQRVVNGGGDVVSEYASGTGRIDLCIKYNNQKYPIELKIRYGDKYVEEGLEKTAGYMDTLGCNEGWMVVFDRRTTVKWEDKIYTKKETVNGKTITVIGA
jgi:type II secretory pathway predicted ATPase ExeA